MPQPRRSASMLFIFITVVIDMIGIGIIIPALPSVMTRFISDPTRASEMYGYFIALYAVMQFFASPVLGALSDLVGRRPVLLVSLFVAGLDFLVMAMAPSLEWLFAARVVSGLTGANYTVAMAYIADVSSDADRSKNFGMLGAAFGLGFIIGPALGGLLGSASPSAPFLLAAGLSLLNVLFGLFVLPESLRAEHRQLFAWSRINPVRALLRIVKIPSVLSFLLVHFLFQLAGMTHPSIWTLYTQFRFHWSMRDVGFSLAATGVLTALSQGVLTGPVVGRLGERRAVILSLLVSVFSFALFGWVDVAWMVYAILAVSAFSWVGEPALQAFITRQVSPREQGELQGAMASLTSLASILNPIIVTQLFAAFTQASSGVQVLGAPYYFAAVISAIACLVAWMGGSGRKPRARA